MSIQHQKTIIISSNENRIERLEMINFERRRLNAALIYFNDLIYKHVRCPQLKEEITTNNLNTHINLSRIKIDIKMKSRKISN